MTNAKEKISMLEQALGARFGEGVFSVGCYAEDENDVTLSPNEMPKIEIIVGDDGKPCITMDSVFPCPEGGSFKSHHLLPRKTLGLMLAGLLRAGDELRSKTRN